MMGTLSQVSGRLQVYFVAGGIDKDRKLLRNAEKLVKNGRRWYVISALLPFDFFGKQTGITVYNKVFFLGKYLI